jgi:hypothetical protein
VSGLGVVVEFGGVGGIGVVLESTTLNAGRGGHGCWWIYGGAGRRWVWVALRALMVRKGAGAWRRHL